MDAVWYHKTVELTEVEVKGRVLLHFGAVDYDAYGSTEQRLDGIKAVIPLLHSISRLMYRPVQTISPYTQRTI